MSGEWKQRDANISVHVEGVFRDIMCDAAESKSDTKQHNNDRNIGVLESKFWSKYKIVGNGDLKSHHILSEGGVNLVLDMVLNPC